MLKQGIPVIIDQENVPLEEDQVEDGQSLYQAEIAFEIARNVATSTMQTSSLEDQNHPFLAEGQNLCNLAIDYKRKRLSVQGVRAKSIHFCNKDLSVFYETNMAIDGSILFKILSAFRICPFFKAQTIIECIRTRTV